MSKGIPRLRKFFGLLSIVGVFLIFGCPQNISEMPNLFALQSRFENYSARAHSILVTESTDDPSITSSLHHIDSTHTINITNTSADRPCPSQVLIPQMMSLPEQQWHADKFWHSANTFPLCTMDSCFDFSHCADMDEFRIYAYGPPYEPILYLKALSTTQWLTTIASKACLFLVTEPQSAFGNGNRPHPSKLPYWNGGLNHVIATFSDKWSLTAPPPHTIGNASVLASCLHETTYRAGFDISMPLPGRTHLGHLQTLKPWSRKYLLTFKGTRYLGATEGNFRSDPALRAMHNGEDVIIAVTCRQVTNNVIRKENPEAGEGCDEDEARYKQYNFKDLMNATFGLAPAGRSPSSYRLIETMSAGMIPILIVDNYVKPFESLIQWHQCVLQFPTSQVARILLALRRLSREEVERRQRYCLFIYNEYLKDDATLARSVVWSLKLRFYGMFPQFNETLPLHKV